MNMENGYRGGNRKCPFTLTGNRYTFECDHLLQANDRQSAFRHDLHFFKGNNRFENGVWKTGKWSPTL
jgi:hypothetical protein